MIHLQMYCMDLMIISMQMMMMMMTADIRFMIVGVSQMF